MESAHGPRVLRIMKTLPFVPSAAFDAAEYQRGAPPDVRSLDPTDWNEFRELSHQALDDMITHLTTVHTGPAWRPTPASVRARFKTPLPRRGREFGEVLEDFQALVA